MTMHCFSFAVRYQLQIESKNEAKYQSIRQSLRTLLKEEGVTALWKGHLPAQYLSAIFMTCQFYGVDLFTRIIYSNFPSLNDNSYKRTFIMSFGGLFGASMATLISFPFDVVRTRIIAQPSSNLNGSYVFYTFVLCILAKKIAEILFEIAVSITMGPWLIGQCIRC